MSTGVVTGASTGLGRLLTARVLDEGHNVVAVGLDVAPLAALAAAHPETLLPLVGESPTSPRAGT